MIAYVQNSSPSPQRHYVTASDTAAQDLLSRGFVAVELPAAPQGVVARPIFTKQSSGWVGEWHVVTEESEEAQRLANLRRAQRDQMLAACDWTQVSDAPVNKVAWATYRQALRDITEQAGFPSQINWPQKPN